MSELEFPDKLKIVKWQPNFPNEDLDDGSLPLLHFYLSERPEVAAHARYLKGTFHHLFQSARNALEISDIITTDDPSDYFAFCKGFASLEYIQQIVTTHQARPNIMMSNTRRLLTSSEVKLELELFNQHDTWREAFPNTNELLIEAGVKEGDTMAQLYSRTKGAQVAYELQKNRPLIVVSD